MATDQILVPTFQALVAIEERILVAFPDMVVFPIQPKARPLQPSVWNWLPRDESEAGFQGTGPTHIDKFPIVATVCVPDTADEQAQGWDLLARADEFMRVVDPALNPMTAGTPYPLGSCARVGRRTSLGTGLHPFPDGAVLGFDFAIEVELSRNFD